MFTTKAIDAIEELCYTYGTKKALSVFTSSGRKKCRVHSWISSSKRNGVLKRRALTNTEPENLEVPQTSSDASKRVKSVSWTNAETELLELSRTSSDASKSVKSISGRNAETEN